IADKERPVQESVTRLMSNSRTSSSARGDRVLFLQEPRYQNRLHGARRSEDCAPQVLWAKVLVSQRSVKLFLDKTLDPYWCRGGGQERLLFEGLQTNLVYFSQIVEVQLECESP